MHLSYQKYLLHLDAVISEFFWLYLMPIFLLSKSKEWGDEFCIEMHVLPRKKEEKMRKRDDEIERVEGLEMPEMFFPADIRRAAILVETDLPEHVKMLVLPRQSTHLIIL